MLASTPGSTLVLEAPVGGNRALVVMPPQDTMSAETSPGSGPAGPRAQEEAAI